MLKSWFIYSYIYILFIYFRHTCKKLLQRVPPSHGHWAWSGKWGITHIINKLYYILASPPSGERPCQSNKVKEIKYFEIPWQEMWVGIGYPQNRSVKCHKVSFKAHLQWYDMITIFSFKAYTILFFCQFLFLSPGPPPPKVHFGLKSTWCWSISSHLSGASHLMLPRLQVFSWVSQYIYSQSNK